MDLQPSSSSYSCQEDDKAADTVEADAGVEMSHGPSHGKKPLKTCSECGQRCHVRCKSCSGCSSEFVFQKELPPSPSKLQRKLPCNLWKIMMWKAQQLHYNNCDVVILMHKRNPKSRSWHSYGTPGAGANFFITHPDVNTLWQENINDYEALLDNDDDYGGSEDRDDNDDDSGMATTSYDDLVALISANPDDSDDSATPLSSDLVTAASMPNDSAISMSNDWATSMSNDPATSLSNDSATSVPNDSTTLPFDSSATSLTKHTATTVSNAPETLVFDGFDHSATATSVSNDLATVLANCSAKTAANNSVMLASNNSGRRRRRKRCKQCEGCLAPKCNNCVSCLKPSYRKVCVKRKCMNLH